MNLWMQLPILVNMITLSSLENNRMVAKINWYYHADGVHPLHTVRFKINCKVCNAVAKFASVTEIVHWHVFESI